MTPSSKEIAVLWKAQKRQYVKSSTYSTYVQLCKSYILPAFGSGSLPDELATKLEEHKNKPRQKIGF